MSHPALGASNIAACAIACNDAGEREQLYDLAAKQHGNGFAAHLREVVEAHHLIVENERSIALIRAVQQSLLKSEEGK